MAGFHFLLITAAYFLLRAFRRYRIRKLNELQLKCPTQLAAAGEYQAAPRGWALVRTALKTFHARVVLLLWVLGIYWILLHDFGLGPVFAGFFRSPDWHWRFPVFFTLAVLANAVLTLLRFSSRGLREAAMKDLEHWRALFVVVGAQALQLGLPAFLFFVTLPLLALPAGVEKLLSQCILVLFIGLFGSSLFTTLSLVEAKLQHRQRSRFAKDERHLRSLETQFSATHRVLVVLIILTTVGSMLMVFDSVRSFGASLLTSAGIVGLIAGVAAQRTLQNLFAGFQLAITQPITLGDEVEVEGQFGVVEEITFSYVSVRLADLRRLILPITYFLEKPFTNWTRISAESVSSFSLILDLRAPLHIVRRELEKILKGNPLWNGKNKDLEIKELRESSMIVEITISAADPRSAKKLKSQVQEELLRFLIGLRGGVLLGAVSDAPKAASAADAAVVQNQGVERTHNLSESSAIPSTEVSRPEPRQAQSSEAKIEPIRKG